MFWVQGHLAFNHIPLVGGIFTLLALLYAIYFKKTEVMQWVVWSYILLALFSWGAYFSGAEAEELVETWQGVSASLIESHEEVALWFLLGHGVLALWAILGWWFGWIQKTGKQFWSMLLALGGGIILIVGLYTAHLGGKIRHPELRGELPVTDTIQEHE